MAKRIDVTDYQGNRITALIHSNRGTGAPTFNAWNQDGVRFSGFLRKDGTDWLAFSDTSIGGNRVQFSDGKTQAVTMEHLFQSTKPLTPEQKAEAVAKDREDEIWVRIAEAKSAVTTARAALENDYSYSSQYSYLETYVQALAVNEIWSLVERTAVYATLAMSLAEAVTEMAEGWTQRLVEDSMGFGISGHSSSAVSNVLTTQMRKAAVDFVRQCKYLAG